MITVYKPKGEPEVKACLPPKFTKEYIYETLPKKSMEKLLRELANYRTLFERDEEWTFLLIHNVYTDVILWKQDEFDPKFADDWEDYEEKTHIKNVDDYNLSKHWESAFVTVRCWKISLEEFSENIWPMKESQRFFALQKLRLIDYEIQRRIHHKIWSYSE